MLSTRTILPARIPDEVRWPMRSYLRHMPSRLGGQLSLPLALILAATACEPETLSLESLGGVLVTVQTVNGTPVPGAKVVLSGTPNSAAADASGQAGLLAKDGTYTLAVSYLGCPPETQDITITSGGSLSVTVTLDCGDYVQDVAWPTGDRLWLLDFASNASGTSDCKNDVLVSGVGLQYLIENAMTADADGNNCHLAALVLAPDRAPFFSNTVADFNWTVGLNDAFSPVMPATKLSLPIRIIVSDPLLNTSQRNLLKGSIQTADLGLATLALDNSYSGISLVDPTGGSPQIEFNDAASTTLAAGCSNVGAIKANTAIYAEDRLNVYYIRVVKNEEGAEKAGYVCATSDAPNIIFIDHNGHFASALAHEIGHALGLIKPFWGHADFFEGFYEDNFGRKLNVMVDGTPDGTESLPADARYYSVGQVARMHLAEASWLNLISPTDGVTQRARQGMPAASTIVACGCPETVKTDDCPAMNRDIDRMTPSVSPRGPSGFLMACTVTATAPTVNICVGSTSQQEAKFFQNGLAAVAATMWVSMDPTVVSATSVVAPAGSMLGNLKGLAVGTATVRAYADGIFAPIAVTVKPMPC